MPSPHSQLLIVQINVRRAENFIGAVYGDKPCPVKAMLLDHDHRLLLVEWNKMNNRPLDTGVDQRKLGESPLN